MTLARFHGGPLDGQILPLENEDDDKLIVPYAETQVVYNRKGEPKNTGPSDGPTEVHFWFEASEAPLNPSDD